MTIAQVMVDLFVGLAATLFVPMVGVLMVARIHGYLDTDPPSEQSKLRNERD